MVVPHMEHDTSAGAHRGESIAAKALMILVIFYREAISPLTPPSCRFEPTCSEYTLEALRVHGALRGTALGVWRVLRCAPWSKGGWDPVPPPRGAPAGEDDAPCDSSPAPTKEFIDHPLPAARHAGTSVRKDEA